MLTDNINLPEKSDHLFITGPIEADTHIFFGGIVATNAAGTGARIALLDATSRGVIEDLVRRIDKVETAIEPRFQHHFVEAMAIPHKTDYRRHEIWATVAAVDFDFGGFFHYGSTLR